jgi:hypothetical protein
MAGKTLSRNNAGKATYPIGWDTIRPSVLYTVGAERSIVRERSLEQVLMLLFRLGLGFLLPIVVRSAQDMLCDCGRIK